MGMNDSKMPSIKDVLSKDAVCLDDNYWKGAICYYLLNDIEESRKYYGMSSLKYEWYK